MEDARTLLEATDVIVSQGYVPSQDGKVCVGWYNFPIFVITRHLCVYQSRIYNPLSCNFFKLLQTDEKVYATPA